MVSNYEERILIGMGFSLEDVVSLNEKIESINVRRTKIEAKQEMLRKRIEDEVAVYEKDFGVSLKGDSLKDTILNIRREFSKVQSEIQKEYEFKSKLVDLIERGDTEEASRLLGISRDDETSNTAVPTGVTDTEERNTAGDPVGMSVPEPIESSNNGKSQSALADKSAGMPGYDDIDEGSDDNPNVYNIGGDFSLDSGDEDVDPVAPSPAEDGKDDADNDIFGGFSFDFDLDGESDSSDDVPDDFGMKDILGGSKFDFN